jgi:hypothetical protein
MITVATNAEDVSCFQDYLDDKESILDAFDEYPEICEGLEILNSTLAEKM